MMKTKKMTMIMMERQPPPLWMLEEVFGGVEQLIEHELLIWRNCFDNEDGL